LSSSVRPFGRAHHGMRATTVRSWRVQPASDDQGQPAPHAGSGAVNAAAPATSRRARRATGRCRPASLRQSRLPPAACLRRPTCPARFYDEAPMQEKPHARPLLGHPRIDPEAGTRHRPLRRQHLVRGGAHGERRVDPARLRNRRPRPRPGAPGRAGRAAARPRADQPHPLGPHPGPAVSGAAVHLRLRVGHLRPRVVSGHRSARPSPGRCSTPTSRSRSSSSRPRCATTTWSKAPSRSTTSGSARTT
jgi:hypothetical protein